MCGNRIFPSPQRCRKTCGGNEPSALVEKRYRKSAATPFFYYRTIAAADLPRVATAGLIRCN